MVRGFWLPSWKALHAWATIRFPPDLAGESSTHTCHQLRDGDLPPPHRRPKVRYTCLSLPGGHCRHCAEVTGDYGEMELYTKVRESASTVVALDAWPPTLELCGRYCGNKKKKTKKKKKRKSKREL